MRPAATGRATATARRNGPALTDLMTRYGARTVRHFRTKGASAQASAAAASAVAAAGLDRVVLLRSSSSDLSGLAAAFATSPDVEYAEPNWIYHVQYTANDPYLNSTGTWGQSYRDLWGFYAIGDQTALDRAQGAGVVVGVIDTGLDLTHEDIQGNVWTNAAEIPGNGVDDDGDGFVDDVHGWNFVAGDGDPTDDNGHGTHVSGTIAARGNNALGIVGIAPQAKILPVKALDATGSGSTLDLTEAMVYAADRGAKVLNCSFGGFGKSQLSDDTISSLYNRGVVVVVAAGNYGSDIGFFSPAGSPGAITVAAVDASNVKASFSNWGDRVDVAAPGVDILSLNAAGGVFSTQLPGNVVAGKYLRLDGTSMATPHVAGVAALLLSQRPTLTPEQVRFLLRYNATPYAGDPQIGAGLVNADAATNHLALNRPVAATVAQITVPAANMAAGTQAPVTIKGTANGPLFSRYELAYDVVSSSPFFFKPFATGTTAVADGVLGTFDPTLVGSDSTVVIRMRVFDTNNMFSETTVHFTLDPTLKKGWPAVISDFFAYDALRSPAFADLDGSGQRAVVTTGTTSIQAFKADGSVAPGFPIALPYPPAAPATITDLDGDGKAEIVVSLLVPPTGSPIYAFHGDGTPVTGFPAGKLASVPAGTLQIGCGILQCDTPVVAADLDGDGVPELAALLIPRGTDTGTEYLTVINGQGQTKTGWPQLVSTTIGNEVKNLAAGDVDGDGQLELVVPSRLNVADAYAIYEASGSLVRTLNFGAITDFSSLALVDVDGDGKAEIFSVNSNGDGTQTAYLVKAADGSPMPGWPVVIPQSSWAPAVITDLDGDGLLDVAVGGTTSIFAYHLSNGTAVAGYPVIGMTGIPNVSGSDQFSISDITVARTASAPGGAFFYGGVLNSLYATDFLGHALPGWPKKIARQGLIGAPALGDMERDGKLEVVGISAAGVLYTWEEALQNGVEMPSDWPVGNANAGRTRNVFRRGYPQIYLRGTHNNWLTTTVMDLVGNDRWRIDATFGSTTTERFKFDVYGNWASATNFGDNNADGIGDANGADIKITQGAGKYRITFNDLTRAYTVTKLNAPAPAAPAGVQAVATSSSSVTVSWNASTGAASYTVYRSTSGSSFTVAGTSGSTSFTDSGRAGSTTYAYYVTASNAAGVASAPSSTVQVTTPPTAFRSTYATMYLRGTMNGWGTTGMALVADYTWEVPVTLSAGAYQYKYDAFANWATNWGENDGNGIGDSNGSNINFTAPAAGTYRFRFNDSTRAYSIVQP
jgi:subtilisin family serine protease